MDNITQQNAALVEQAAAAAESLQEQAQALAQAVSRFHLKNGMQAPATAARTARSRSGMSQLARLGAPA